MTREEASKVIKDGLEDMSLDYFDEEQYEALAIAIKALEQEPSGDLISRQAVLDAMYDLCNTDETLKENPWRDNPHIDAIIDAIEDLPSVNPQEPKWDRLYSWLNDMRLGIAPDETVTDIDERNVRTAQVDLLDEIMEWIEKHPQEPKTEILDKIRAEIEKHTDGNNHCDEYLDGYNNGMKDALEIIDKYRNKEG